MSFPYGWTADAVRAHFTRLAHELGTTVGQRKPRPTVVDVPAGAFISHSYAERDNLQRLLQLLPSDFGPIVYEPIVVPPTEFVSTPLFEAVRAAPALIYLVEGGAGASPWVAIERDIALRAGKPVFAFRPSTGSFERDEQRPKSLRIHCVYGNSDRHEAEAMIEWMAAERNFELEPFSPFEWTDMGEYAADVMEFGGIFLAITGQDTIRELPMGLVRVACEGDEDSLPSQRLVIACLDPPGPWIHESIARYAMSHGVIDLTDGGGTRPWSTNRLDDLIARLVWLM